ncbi:MAG TPA: protein-glutamate O-methyltransferase CheR [Myxococcaceae bacterium]|nr:protein-glutamate O-methyltransferase CheR [Myxococcaceae bacterium]
MSAAIAARLEEDVEEIELELLLEGIYRHYGADFREYSRASLRRRMWNMIREENLESISGLQAKVLHDPEAMQRLLRHLSVTVTTMFRDPSFFRAFRAKVVPHLRTAPFVRVWAAGCSTGEEVYSLAIVLHEENLYERARIYATDMSAEVVEQAKSGIFRAAQMQEYTHNYLAAGGTAPFSQYYTAQYERAIFKQWLKRNIVFAQHNLAVDRSFNEFHVVVCRNVMIYFNAELQARAHELVLQSLRRGGFLCLGRRESLRGCATPDTYEVMDDTERIFRRVA